MQGTEWTEPGTGAEAKDLADLVCVNFSRNPRTATAALANLSRFDFDKRGVYNTRHRTNLALTGAPLTAEDLARIAEAK